ncbi:MAG: hypothetical protein Q9174_001117 [Haloplaca sp. 1 TL-2023]
MGFGLAMVANKANGAMTARCVTMHASHTHALVAHFRWFLKSLLLAVAHACWTAHNDAWNTEGEGGTTRPSMEPGVLLADAGDELGYCEEGSGEDGSEMDGEGVRVTVNGWMGVVGALAGAEGAAVRTAETFLDVEVGSLACKEDEEGEGE